MKSEPNNEVQNGNSKSGLASKIISMMFKGCLATIIISTIASVIIVVVIVKSCENHTKELEVEEISSHQNPSLEKLISYIEQSGSMDDDEVQKYREAKANEKTNEDSKVVETVGDSR